MPDHLLGEIIIGLCFAAGIYGGIRADLRSLHLRLNQIERSAIRCHDRLDEHLDRQRKA